VHSYISLLVSHVQGARGSILKDDPEQKVEEVTLDGWQGVTLELS